MHSYTSEPHTAQQSDAVALNPLMPLVRVAVEQTVAQLDERTLPVRQRYLRADAASRFVGVDKITLAQWRSKGVGPKFRRIGTRILYSVESLITFVEKHPLVGTGTLP